MFIIIDTETTGFPVQPNRGYYYDPSQIAFYDSSRMVSICWALYKNDGTLVSTDYSIVKPTDFTIDNKSIATSIHGITQEIAEKRGKGIHRIMSKLAGDIEWADTIVGHNIIFDLHILLSELYRYQYKKEAKQLRSLTRYCTMKHGTPLTKLPSKFYKKYKFPKLSELYKHLFNKSFDGAHNAFADVKACAKCYLKMNKMPIDQKVKIS